MESVFDGWASSLHHCIGVVLVALGWVQLLARVQPPVSVAVDADAGTERTFVAASLVDVDRDIGKVPYSWVVEEAEAAGWYVAFVHIHTHIPDVVAAAAAAALDSVAWVGMAFELM